MSSMKSGHKWLSIVSHTYTRHCSSYVHFAGKNLCSSSLAKFPSTDALTHIVSTAQCDYFVHMSSFCCITSSSTMLRKRQRPQHAVHAHDVIALEYDKICQALQRCFAMMITAPLSRWLHLITTGSHHKRHHYRIISCSKATTRLKERHHSHSTKTPERVESCSESIACSFPISDL